MRFVLQTARTIPDHGNRESPDESSRTVLLDWNGIRGERGGRGWNHTAG